MLNSMVTQKNQTLIRVFTFGQCKRKNILFIQR